MKSNAVNSPTLVLELSGEITVDLEVKPPRIAFGELGKAETATRPFTVKIHEPDTAKLGAVHIEDSRFEVVKKTDAAYDLNFKGGAILQPISAKLYVEVQGESPRTLEVPITAKVVGNISHTRNLYFLRKDGAFVEKEIKLTSRSGRVIKVLGIKDDGGQLQATAPEKPAKEHVIPVRVVDPKASYTQHKRGALVVKTDDKDMPEISITYTISESRVPVVSAADATRAAPERFIPPLNAAKAAGAPAQGESK